ncbi:MAG: sigma-54 dependent transcriptional regulator [candidate division KSB1 bacterium]|nr:sigma-54 dependent transcriptional regulator [candidate division KSB1 bacterium]MDQ7066208.1 sigma-54 dependent transcriptional regulator [candidate division KSB1 bacterium]
MNAPQAKPRVLVIEDNATMLDGLEQVLTYFEYPVQGVQKAEDALKAMRESVPDIVICDYKLPGMDGITVLEKIKADYPQVEVILITAFGSIELAVEAMQKGAADFITKPFSADEIGVKLERLAQQLAERQELARLTAENQYLRDRDAGEFNYGEIIGRSETIQGVFRTIEKVAPTDASVIIYGESGTGKELVARALHKKSPRRDGPFIRVNCGALAEGVLESELFGHEKGAFTGALRRRPGRFELAHGGTLFLDEIGDIPLATQVKLLRVLQEKEFERVGGEETIRVDVRIIAATHKNLQQEVKEGRFREDLFYRLHIVPITLPPLRDRLEDVPLLAEHFLRRLQAELKKPGLRIESEALKRLQAYSWPGNVRELENVLERAAVLCENNVITASDLPPLDGGRDDRGLISDENLNLNATLARVEQMLIRRALEKAGGVKSRAAQLLGLRTNTLFYKMEKYGLE